MTSYDRHIDHVISDSSHVMSYYKLPLQTGTHLIVNEMAMGPGQLGERGVANLTALGCVVQWQKVKYDFKYHTQEFECNLVSDVILDQSNSSKILILFI